ncbi:unnamed protein product [Rotaria socialis]|uniref:Fibronectin type-III domain-containing protein n=1 Tax=Rotaria socialis TaxID=392032 RepID=A0A821C0W9_9BILA|nr:unnamed protein product [Rotaria socialis]CAF3482080.1 unnamed protein product [Rotaria socialis]CAF4520353.1 unnamed protein product [Rotaria socialis]CAF4600121.1 unnamed protein product [Rotaria socialis]
MSTRSSLIRSNMSSEKHSTLKMMALNRPCELGMLYDFINDKFISEISFWNSNLSSENINCQHLSLKKCELFITDKFREKADLLGIDNNLKLSILANLVELSGSTKLIDDRKKTNFNLRFILKYSIEKDLRALTMTFINKNYGKYREVLDKNIATHVVTDILYGGDIVFVFDRTVFNDENRTDIENSIKLLLKKFEQFQILDNGELNWKDHEKNLAGTLKCQYYGDFQIEVNPTTFEETVKIYKQLKMLIRQNNYNAIPKQIWICPLYLLDEFRFVTKNFNQISDNILVDSIETFEYLYKLEIITNDLFQNLSSIQMFHRTKQQFLTHLSRISEIEVLLRNQFVELLPKIRAGSIEENTLQDRLGTLNLFSSDKRRLDDWIELNKKKIELFEMILNQIRTQENIHRLTCSFAEFQKNFKNKFILRLIIHITEKNDSFLNEIFQYFNHKKSQFTYQGTKKENWFNKENIASMKQQVSLFVNFAQHNHSKSNIQFIIDEEYTDEFQMNQGLSYILYQNGVPTDFEMPSKPGKPFVTNVSEHNLTLDWSKPTNGSRSIQQYKIYRKTISHNKWELLLTTVDSRLSVNISNLGNGKYQFKIQGITLAGDTDESDASAIVELPPPTLIEKIISKPVPIVTPNQITAENATVDVTPEWFKQMKPVPKEKIRFPASYKENSPKDIRTYECLSVYRSMVKKTDNIDFVAEPFSSAVNNTETLVVVLNELANQFGARLTFTDANFQYKDSNYRTACGIANLGSIHSFLATERNFQTAKFNLHLNLNYNDIIRSPGTLENFVLKMINDTSAIARCDKDFIRVFSVKSTSSIHVEVGITTPEIYQTKKVAEIVKESLRNISKGKRPDIVQDSVPYTFQKLIPYDYDYKFETVIAFLQLQMSDFDPRYNRDYPNANTEIRGGFPYYFPQGWYRHALKVDDKYFEDQAWLGMNNGPGEWAVAYHGTQSNAVKGIKNDGFLQDFTSRDLMKDEAKCQNQSVPDVKGLYVATHCEGGASIYSRPFTIKDSKDASKNYKIVFQCRVQPEKFTQHQTPVDVGMAWRVFDEKAIRPYGLLLKTS